MAKQIFLKQRTKAWHDFRFEHIGSSDAALIIGDVHPMERDTSDDLMMRKITRTHKHFSGKQLQHITRGKDREDELLNLYHRRYDLDYYFEPVVFESSDYPFLGASLDGWHDGIILEIKSTTNLNQHKKVMQAEMPSYYYPQVQHQLLVTGADEVRFLSFYNGLIPGDTDNNNYFLKVNLAELRIKRDDEYCKKLLEAEVNWWHEFKRRAALYEEKIR